MTINKDHTKPNVESSGQKRNTTRIIGLNETASKKDEKLKDQNLWLKLKLGIEEAFRDLFIKYNPLLSNYGLSIIDDEFAVEDCIHDLFLYIWSNKESLADVESVKYYLVVSFRRRIFKVLEERAKSRKLLDGIKLEYPKYENFFDRQFLENQDEIQLQKRINQSVNQLAQRQKEVLQLRYIEGLGYQEISKKMGISVNSVRKHSSKAIIKLRKSLL